MKMYSIAPICASLVSIYLLVSCGANSRPTATDTSVLDTEALGDLHAERGWRPTYLELATGEISRRAEDQRAPWPFQPLSIGHSSASYQNYGSSPYFHHGIDIRGDAGTEVRASVGGKVVNIENYMPGPAYWEVAILDDEGFLWQYHHIDRQSIPAAIHEAFKNGTQVAAGTKLGEIFYWQVTTFGERFHHVHLNILGANRQFANPLLFLTELPDAAAPVFVETGLLQNGERITAPRAGTAYTVFAKVHDLMLHQKFVIPPNRIDVKINEDEPFTVWDFDRGLPGGDNEETFVSSFFVPSLTCGNYSCRALTINLGFTKSGNRTFPQDPGQHVAVITATDAYGNQAEQRLTWQVQATR